MGWDSMCNSVNGNRLMTYLVHYLPELSCLSPHCSVMVKKCIISWLHGTSTRNAVPLPRCSAPAILCTASHAAIPVTHSISRHPLSNNFGCILPTDTATIDCSPWRGTRLYSPALLYMSLAASC